MLDSFFITINTWMTSASAIAFIGTKAWRSDGIPLVGDGSVKARFSDTAGDSMVISLEQAAEQFEKGISFYVAALKQLFENILEDDS